jgi:hypothetical protein
MMERFRYENPVERIIVDIQEGHTCQNNFPLELQFLRAMMTQSALHKFLWRQRQKETPFLWQQRHFPSSHNRNKKGISIFLDGNK